MFGASQKSCSPSAAVAVFVFLFIAPCCGATPCSGQECAADTKSQVAGKFDDDVVSLLHVTGKPHHRSQQAANSRKTTQDDQQMGDTDEASLLALENELLKPSSSTRLENSESGMMGSMWHIVHFLIIVVILGLVVQCFPHKALGSCFGENALTKGTILGDAVDQPIRKILSPFQLFTQEYLNRLMLMAGAAILLNAGGAFVHLCMPDNAKDFELWQVILFTVCAVAFMILFAVGYGILKAYLLGLLDEGKKKKNLDQLLTQTENIIMIVNGSILAGVWLMRYPVPASVPIWVPILIFFGIVWLCIGIEYIKVCITPEPSECCGMKLQQGICYNIMSTVHNVIFGTFTFILVGFLVTDVRNLAGLGAKERPEMSLAAICMIVTLICVFTSPALIKLKCSCCLFKQECCCWCSKRKKPKMNAKGEPTDESEWEDSDDDKKREERAQWGKQEPPAPPPTTVPAEKGLGQWFGEKSLTLLNNIFLFTTGTIIFQILTMTDEYQANVWILSLLFILVGAAILACLPLVLLGFNTICACFDEETRVATATMFTVLVGWLAGKMIAACFALLITGVDRLVWLPIGLGFLLLAMLAEFIRQQIYECLSGATNTSLEEVVEVQN